MKKIISCICLAFVMVLFVFPMSAFAASVGDTLTAPEKGWQRIDNTDTNIIYSAGWATNVNSKNYKGAHYYTELVGSTKTINFEFYGTKLRILDLMCVDRLLNNATITIDNVSENYNDYTSSEHIYQVILYEKTGLALENHKVSITYKNTTERQKYAGLDAIDIDDNGHMVNCYNLKAQVCTKSVILNWSAIDGASSYNIYRSTTAGGPYTKIATNVAADTYTDSEVTNGTTYFYTVTAISEGGESTKSNEVSATPQETVPTPAKSKAILRITMVTSKINEYEMTSDEISAFITWYNDKNKSDLMYAISKTYNLGPFTSRKDYIPYDKIADFEVMEY